MTAGCKFMYTWLYSYFAFCCLHSLTFLWRPVLVWISSFVHCHSWHFSLLWAPLILICGSRLSLRIVLASLVIYFGLSETVGDIIWLHRHKNTNYHYYYSNVYSSRTYKLKEHFRALKESSFYFDISADRNGLTWFTWLPKNHLIVFRCVVLVSKFSTLRQQWYVYRFAYFGVIYQGSRPPHRKR